MGNFQLPRTTALDTTGITIPGAKLYFYAAGTSTPITVYADRENTVPLTNPVVADGNGRFADIYVPETTSYKIDINTPLDVNIYTVDNLDPFALNNTSLEERLKQIASNPLDYGAIGNGLANEVAAVQSAIDNSVGTIDLLGKTYRCDTSIIIPQGRRFINGTLDFSLCNDPSCIVLAPGTIGTALALTADVALGESSLTISSTSTLSSGDFLILRKTTAWSPAKQGTSEVVRVRAITGATTLTLDAPVRFDYTVAASSQVLELGLMNRFYLADLRILGAASINQNAISASVASNVHITNVDIQGVAGSGISLSNCVDSRVIGCSFRDCTFSSTGNGVDVLDSCSGIVVTDCFAADTNTGVNVGDTTYITHDVSITGNVFEGCRVAGVFVSETCNNILVSANEIVGSQDSNCNGIYSGGKAISICDNKIRAVKRNGIRCEPSGPTPITGGTGVPAQGVDQVWLAIKDNEVGLCGENAILVSSIHGAFDGLEIDGNLIGDFGLSGITVNAETTTNVRAGSICNNKFNLVFSTGSAIAVNALPVSGTSVTGFSVSNNVAHGVKNTAKAIYLRSLGSKFDQCSVSNNVVDGGLFCVAAENVSSFKAHGNSGNSGIIVSQIDTSSYTNISIDNNNIDGSSSTGLFFEARNSTVKNVSITNNCVNTSTGSSLAVACDDGSIHNLTVSANNLAISTFGIEISIGGSGSIEVVSVCGNTINTTTLHGISLKKFAGTLFRAVSVSGNTISSASGNGIYFSSISDISVSSNSVILSGVGLGDAAIYSECASGDASCVSITANTIFSGRGISVNSSGSAVFRDIVIGSNTVSDTGGSGSVAGSISLNATGTSTMTRLSLSGNTVKASSGNGININANGVIALFSIIGNHIFVTNTANFGVNFEGSGSIRKGTVSANSVGGGLYSFNRTVTTLEIMIICGNLCYDYASDIAADRGLGFRQFNDPIIIGGTAPNSFFFARTLDTAISGDAWPNFNPG